MNPCPQCGAPLRWIPEAGIWNCDRCGNRVAPAAAPPTPPPQQGGQHGYPPQQQGYPPQQHGYPPQQGYPPQGYGHYPHHGPPGKSRGKLVAIIAAVGALAAGGIVLAIVLSKKGSGDDGGGGFDNPEALAKATLEALVAGDADKLFSFTPPFETMMGALDCPPEAKAENEKQAKQGVEEAKKRFAEAAAKMKGSGATFKKVNTDIGRQEMKVGDAVGPCKAKVAVTMTGVGIEHDFVNPGDKSKQEHKATYGVMILDGKYYLLDTGEVPAALGGAGGDTPTTPDTPPPDTPTTPPPDPNAAIAELEKIRSAVCSCTDKACVDAAVADLPGLVQKYADAVSTDPVIKDKYSAIANDISLCLKKFDGAQTPPPDTPTTPTEPGQGLPECEAYAKAAERFIKCSKVPKQSRDAVKTAVDTMRKNWGDPSKMSDDMKKSAAETCTTLEKSMKDAAAAIGCR
jgi:hypothetical protein